MIPNPLTAGVMVEERERDRMGWGEEERGAGGKIFPFGCAWSRCNRK